MALVVFLKGINVGGHRRFRPSTLAARLAHLDAVNIGAAGTFVVRRPATRTQLRAEITRRLPFDAEVVICDGREIVRLLADNPFEGTPAPADVVRFVSVLSRRPRRTPSLPIALPDSGDWLLEVLARDGRFLFGHYRRHMRVIGYLGKLDAMFGVAATTRNWNTIKAIAATVGER